MYNVLCIGMMNRQILMGYLIELIELRKKFEEDKKKIELLKATRRFRPY